MNDPIILDGTKPLWESGKDYVAFVERHDDELWAHSEAGDENAELIIDLIVCGLSSAERVAAFMVTVERYISDYHPDIAVIKGRLKDKDDTSRNEKA